jgi:hypothetical protein
MMIFGMVIKIIRILVKTIIVLIICSTLLYITYKGNQPMNVPQAPRGMTYFGFMADRLDAAKTVKPARCGWGLMLSLAVLGPIYSIVYTETAIHPDGLIAKMTAPDSNIPKEVAGAKWYAVPGIWWNTVERLSWTMLGITHSKGCKFSSVL